MNELPIEIKINGKMRGKTLYYSVDIDLPDVIYNNLSMLKAFYDAACWLEVEAEELLYGKGLDLGRIFKRYIKDRYKELANEKLRKGDLTSIEKAIETEIDYPRREAKDGKQ